MKEKNFETKIYCADCLGSSISFIAVITVEKGRNPENLMGELILFGIGIDGECFKMLNFDLSQVYPDKIKEIAEERIWHWLTINKILCRKPGLHECKWSVLIRLKDSKHSSDHLIQALENTWSEKFKAILRLL